MTELWLSNGLIVDGSGTAARPGSMHLRDGKIAGILPPGSATGASAVDCAGLVISPGFIDVHTHSDYEVIRHRTNKILQGVTTEFVGNCGFSLFPMRYDGTGLRAGSRFETLPLSQMTTARDYFTALESAGSLVNVASLTGHSALRSFVMGMDRRQPSHGEMSEMQGLLRTSLDEGAIGFSTGLNCFPSGFAEFEELVALCGVLKPYGAFYTTHMRNYASHVFAAVEESIRLAETAGVALQLSHLQVVGRKNWHRLDAVLELVDAAVRRGVDIGIDAYPFLAGSCSLLQYLPQWSLDGGVATLLDRLDSDTGRDRIARETEDTMSNTWSDVMIADLRISQNPEYIGQSIQRIADLRGRAPRDTAIDLIREEQGQIMIISFNNNDGNLRRVLTHPLCSICSDSFLAEGLSHPRAFATYPSFLGRFVRDERWMTLEEGVRKATLLPASRFRMRNRGEISPGNHADIVIFDYSAIGSDADYVHPDRPAQGIRHVLVNGEFAVRDGQLTGTLPGSVIHHLASN